MKNTLITGCLMLATFTGYSQPAQNNEQQFVTIENMNGPTLGYSLTSGVSILKVNLPATSLGSGLTEGTYNGKNFKEGNAKSWNLTDQQKIFLRANDLRHILMTHVDSPASAARWNNEMQAFTESLGLGIPCNTSSDPRHAATGNSEFNSGNGGAISLWPDGLGLAATFDPAVVKRFGEIAAREYRAM